MKRKQRSAPEQRRRLVEFNMVDESRRLPVPRRGCLSLFGSILMIGGTAFLLSLGLH